jgi:HEAT repeat protein
MLKLPALTRNLPAALRDATHAKESVRLSAVSDLGALAQSHQDAVHALERALAEDTSVEVRAAAAVALADGASQGSVSLLLRACEEDAPRVRQMALLALGELARAASPGVAPALHRALDDPLPALRFQALCALATLGVDVPASIMRGLRDGDVQVRLLALRLLADDASLEQMQASSLPWVVQVRSELT